MSVRTNKMSENELINAKNLIALEIEERTNALSLVDKVIKVVKNFNNKVFNVRFEKALQEQVDSGLRVSGTYRDIIYHFHNRYVLEHKDTYACAIYVQYDTVALTNLYRNEAYEGNRINAEIIVKNLLERKQEEQERIELLKKSINKLAHIDNRYIELLTKLNDYIDSVDYNTRAYLHIAKIY